jgi:predicted dehydrogenase
VKQVVQIPRSGDVRVMDVPPPILRPGGALVATRASLISAGTERSKIELGKASLVGKARARPDMARQVVERARRDGVRDTYRAVTTRLETPAPLGYSSCGVVLEAAPDCRGVSAGDLVACAGGGYANHAEVNFVPQNLLARVPAGVSPVQAAYGTVGAIALHGVRLAGVAIGERVAVIGLGLVGLLAVQVVRAAGGRAIATDIDPRACELAARLGVERVIGPGESVEVAVDALSEGVGVDAVLVCAATPSSQPIELAAAICRDRGRVVVVGDVGMDIPRRPFYEKELELRVSRSYGPGRYDPHYEEHGQDYPIGYVRWPERRNLEELLRLIADGLVDVTSLTTHRFPVEEAAGAYALVAGDGRSDDRPVGVVLEYPGVTTATPAEARIELRTPVARGTIDIGVGVIGAGSFATRVLLPALRDDKRVHLTGVCTASGVTARQVAERFGFAHVTSSADELLNDPSTDAVVIATRHDSHASLAARALSAGKAVFCEKPLATTWDDLEIVASAFADSQAPLLVGFNRRFSPLVEELRAALPQGVPFAFLCRVNAGPLPAGHWLNDPATGGGRLVGELCHFLDLACHVAGSRPIRVSAEALGSGQRDESGSGQSAVVQVAFANGSVASLQYLANGDPSLPKERIDVFAGGVTAILDDFRSVEVIREGSRHVRKAKHQEKGHREEMLAFVDAASGAAPSGMSPEDVFWSSALTLQVPVSLGLGRPAPVDLPEALGGLGAAASYPREAPAGDEA